MFRQRNLVINQIFLKLFGMLERILGLAFVWRFVSLPLDEPPANGVVFQLVQRVASCEQLGRHRIWVMEISFWRVEYDVFQAEVQGRGTDRDLMYFVGISG